MNRANQSQSGLSRGLHELFQQQPKKRPKKAARKKAVAVAQEDSELHSLNLSLASVETALSGEATYASAAAVLNKFKVIEYGTKLKAPTVRTIASLPPTKPIIPPASITRILRPEQISICNQKVTAFQSKHKGTAEKDLVVDIPGFGVYDADYEVLAHSDEDHQPSGKNDEVGEHRRLFIAYAILISGAGAARRDDESKSDSCVFQKAILDLGSGDELPKKFHIVVALMNLGKAVAPLPAGPLQITMECKRLN
ncbi:hypothetical protein PInf_020034 [Phytophthora infestans]|nr:hypothetical protein PInf_020034 [Phytophthora infestans]